MNNQNNYEATDDHLIYYTSLTLDTFNESVLKQFVNNDFIGEVPHFFYDIRDSILAFQPEGKCSDCGECQTHFTYDHTDEEGEPSWKCIYLNMVKDNEDKYSYEDVE